MFEDDNLNNLTLNDDYIIGCDEVGTGTAAGPLVVCGVRAEKDWKIDGLNDSKKLSEKKRNIMRSKLLDLENKDIIFWIAERSNERIDEIGLGAALKEAYVEVFTKLYIPKSFIVADGNLKFEKVRDCKIISMVKADTKIPSVMAASILAKTYRDEIMKNHHLSYDKYGWNTNVGYLTAEHIEAISKFGYTPLHRRSFNIKK